MRIPPSDQIYRSARHPRASIRVTGVSWPECGICTFLTGGGTRGHFVAGIARSGTWVGWRGDVASETGGQFRWAAFRFTNVGPAVWAQPERRNENPVLVVGLELFRVRRDQCHPATARKRPKRMASRHGSGSAELDGLEKALSSALDRFDPPCCVCSRDNRPCSTRGTPSPRKPASQRVGPPAVQGGKRAT